MRAPWFNSRWHPHDVDEVIPDRWLPPQQRRVVGRDVGLNDDLHGLAFGQELPRRGLGRRRASHDTVPLDIGWHLRGAVRAR